MRKQFCVLYASGINCEGETQHAIELARGSQELVHINELRDRSKSLLDYAGLVIPGGFSYGDDIASGRVLANELEVYLGDELREFIARGRLVMGICNGFQVLVRSGLLPFNTLGTMQVTLAHNTSGHFECRWVELKCDHPCVFTQGIGDSITLPIAHGEGRFGASDRVLEAVERQKLVPLRYAVNPNGSTNGIAALCRKNILGMMPHPERFVRPEDHPNWRCKKIAKPHGLQIFQNAVKFAS